MEDNCVENSTFTIPHLQNGVQDIGDLWDCRRSLALQHNLLTSDACIEEHIQATPLRNSDYTFTHIKNEHDKIRNLKIDGHISIDLFLTVIKLDGSIKYNAETKENCENFIVNYTYEDHKIYLISPLGKDVNRHLIEKLNSKEIEVTHVVGGIIVGGEVHGVVEVKNKNASRKLDLAGGGGNKNSTKDDKEGAIKLSSMKTFLDKLSGCVTGELKASWLSTTVNNESDIRVNFKAKPTPIDASPTAPGENNSGNGPPGSVKSMFEFIDNMPQIIRKETSFQRFGKDIFGVPIRFILYPLSHYIDFNIQRMYKQLDDCLMRKFQETVSQIIDIQHSAYVKKLILEEDEEMSFFFDSKSPLLADVSKFEKQLRVIGAEFEVRCRKAMAEYKFGKQCQDDIHALVKEFNQSKAGSVCTKVLEFVAYGRLELLNGQVFQAKGKMVIFTDRGNLDKWYGANSGPLVLMETKSPSQPGAIKGLSELSEFLHNVGVDVGMAIPSVSKEATLTLKFCDRKTVFKAEEITHALDTLKTMAGIAEPTSAAFYRIITSLKGIRLFINKQNSCDLDRIVSEIIRERSSYNNLYCADSLADLRKQMSTVDDKSFVFCLPVNAPDTDLEFLIKWDDLSKHLPNARWVVYNFDFPDFNEAPLLMIFKESRLQAICLDNLDVLYLKYQLLKTTGIDLTMLSPEKLQNCLYPERAKYALAVLSRLEPLRHVQAVENQELLKTRTNNVVEEFLMLLRSLLSCDPSHMASAMTARSSFEAHILNCLNILQEMEKDIRNRSKFDDFKSELNAVFDYSLCPDSFKEQLKEIMQSGESVDKILIRAGNILQEMIRTLKPRKSSFKKVWKTCSRSPEAEELVEETLRDLVKEYCTFQQIFQEPLITRMTNYAQDCQPYLLLHSVSNYKYSKGMQLLYEGLRQLTSLNDFEALQHIIQCASTALDETQIEALWRNSQWQFLVEMCIESERNATVFRALWEWLQRTENKDTFPENIKAKLEERFKIFGNKFRTVKDVAGIFQVIIDLFEQVPPEFNTTLADSLKESEQLERELCESLTRPDWNSEVKLAETEWDMNKVKLALRCLTESIQSKEALALAVDFNLIFFKMPITQQDELLDRDERIGVCFRFRESFGNHLRFITDKEYMTVKRIIPQPIVCAETSMSVLVSLVPYILQQIKMWNGNILKPYVLSSILKTDQNSTKRFSLSNKPFKNSAKPSPYLTPDQATVHAHSVTRLDIFAYLINAADCFVAREILKVMSKFPLPLPLVIPHIFEENKYIITVPILENLIIRWETEDVIEKQTQDGGNSCKEKEYIKKVSHIVENHLFSSPFLLVVAIRLGTHKPGKSQLLNQLMADVNFFSAYGEPGGKRGPPSTLDGTVEFAWLTKETCDCALWTFVMETHYARRKNEIVLLANMHGDATKHLDILNYLKKFAFGFLVFLMPEVDVCEKWDLLTSEIEGKPITYVKVDPSDYDEGDLQTILTSQLTHDTTKQKLRDLLESVLSYAAESTRASGKDALTADLGESLRFGSVVDTTRAHQLAKEVCKITCVEAKKCMTNFLDKGYDGWKDNDNLKKIVGVATQLLNNSMEIDLKKAVSYLETELSRISASESLSARLKVAETQRLLHDCERHIKQNAQTEATEQRAHNESIRYLTEKLRIHKTEAEDANFGLEHFYRVFSHIHHIALGHYSPDRLDNSGVLELPKYFAALLLEGHALELLNGDTSQIPIDWLRAIFRHVDVLKPNLRVFVISIIGLQSSGKSTLLNALFSCRFAVSVGRCSRGLYMRMIFLEEDLRKQHGYDAIILIDTEGLASSEKMNDPDASRKDRLLATFAMGLSNLTIVNVLGEELTKITDILQIVIVTMARLREADVKPDMIVVQHLLERNSIKLDEAKQQFINAIKRAFDLVHEKDVEIGATHNACLTELIQGVKRHDVFLQFSSFKDGSSVHAPPSESYHKDVVDLYQMLLMRARNSTCKLSIQRWFQLTENYWNSVTQEKFALDFKSAQHITEYLNYSKKVTKLKETIGQAFTFHADKMSKITEDKISTGLTGNPRKQLEDLREDVTKEVDAQLSIIPYDCEEKCHYCQGFISENNKLSMEIKGTKWEYELEETVDKCIGRKCEREMTILKQIFDVSMYRRGCFSEFSDLITKELKKELKERPSGKFSEEEKTEMIERIWNRVNDIISTKERGSSLLEEIEQAIISDCEDIHPDIWRRIKEDFSEEILKNRNAKKGDAIACFQDRPLDKANHLQLLEKVQHLIRTVLTSSEHKCFSVGMKFEAGLITVIRGSIPEMLKQYEKEAEVELINDYKDNVIVYALGAFVEEMEKLQEKWDQLNKPSFVLYENESVFKEEIRARLDHGFSSAADGYVQAGYIIDEAKEKARKAGYGEKIASVLDRSWITNSENVRLQFFEELASEVNKGRKDRALAHFSNPKDSIETWFKEKIELTFSTEKVRHIYEQTLTREIECVLRNVENSSNFDNLQRFLQKYHFGAKGKSCGKADLQENAFVSFQDSIVRKLQEFSQTHQSEFVTYALASEDERVMNRLGCTESCPWCGALCWFSRGHHEDNGETQKHQSCHQPNGLVGTAKTHNSTQFLDPRGCQDIPDSEQTFVFLHGYEQPGICWSQAKTQYFGSWKFYSHAIKQFDQLMRWFFQELHEDMSAASRKSPVPPDWLDRYKCKGLKLADILATVRSVKN